MSRARRRDWTAEKASNCVALDVALPSSTSGISAKAAEGCAPPLTDADVVAAIRRQHLKANIAFYEVDGLATVHWGRATVDPGGTIFGGGPYLKVPVSTVYQDEIRVRVYPPERLRKQLAQRWRRA